MWWPNYRRHVWMATVRSLIGVCVFFFSPLNMLTAQSYSPEAGWRWLLPPIPAPRSLANIHGVSLASYELTDGRFLLIVTCPYTHERVRLNAVAIDPQGNISLYPFIASSSDGKYYSVYHFALPSSVKIHRIGLTELTTDSVRLVLSPKAYASLVRKGLNAVAYPQIGQPLAFRLRALDGHFLQPDSLKGKIVLLDFWASWCSLCMTKMPLLKKLYRRYSPERLAIVGINYDASEAIAREWITRYELVWPQAMAPTDEADRELWYQSCGIEVLPRLLALDKDGLLIGDLSIMQIESFLDSLIHPSR